ncbi:hypothetical protein TNCT_63241 [Trichonephila clavata]|uniref:Uncharacterized protein n=1 Tax=Trichonephila clavata TaxID=2740835 RepID=A0A8X6I415_TRICU|nr:hypothetical protein TNCT_63241 [Trichonephila clavata]
MKDVLKPHHTVNWFLCNDFVVYSRVFDVVYTRVVSTAIIRPSSNKSPSLHGRSSKNPVSSSHLTSFTIQVHYAESLSVIIPIAVTILQESSAIFEPFDKLTIIVHYAGSLFVFNPFAV